MQETWQGSLKQLITEEYVKNSQEWLEVNISTSGLLNLTIVSDRFVDLSLPKRKEQVLSFLERSQVPHLSPGFLSLYTLQEAESLNILRPQVVNGSSVYTWQDLALQAANPQNQSQLIQREARVPRTVTFYSFTVVDSGEHLWSIFSREIQEQLKPDILLVDSRTGINQWGAFSLLQAADEVIIFLFPNEQNRQGIDLLLQSLQVLKNITINFVFTPVPDVTEIGLAKVRKIWKSLHEKIKNVTDGSDETNEDETNNGELDLDEPQSEVTEPLVVPYLSPIALADNYPVPALIDYYTRIANLIDEETDDLKRRSVLTSTSHRWEIIEGLYFPEVNAANPKQNLGLLFQRTTDFERFLDDTTCLVRGRKGTGKTALYWLLLKHTGVAQQLSHGRLDNTRCFSAHGRFHESCPSRDEFQIIHRSLQAGGGSWEAFWRGYLLFRLFQEQYFSFPKGQQGKKFSDLKAIISSLSGERWQYEYTQALLKLSTESDLRLIVKDAIDIIDEKARKQSQMLWFLYDDLDEDFPEEGEVRQKALTGLFQFVQACDARRLTTIRFKIFLREDIWNRLNFDNKSHFNGLIPPFDDFVNFLSEIGLAEWREKEQRYKLADIYVYGFGMIRKGTV